MTQLKPLINSNDHLFGNPAASLELVEYGDYECPHCRRAYPIVKAIKEILGPELKFVFRNFPLSNIHPHAFMAAVATEAAGLQGRFWEMHDIVFENQKNLEVDNLLLLASNIGLDIDRFESDLRSKALHEKVEKDFESGMRSGVNGTPTFFINGRKFEGDWSRGALLEELRAVLA
ncbi:MAG: DsbA family protein [Bacteroidetes bacterium]|nr:DsbA family protein [Bacteroidota bacterium]